MMFDEDLALQLQLQEKTMSRKPSIMDLPDEPTVHRRKSPTGSENKDPSRKKISLIDPSFEYIDPTPDVRAMFLQFNSRFFWGRLYAVEVKWSPRMTSCAGVCCYEGRGGLCSVRLSEPLLKLRPRKDLVETLLHEMIHAYLFVTNNDRDRDGHGPEFHKHMYRINKEAGTNITVYHDFYDEVKLYQQHWWRCSGPCQKWRPYFGMVKRAMNRPPGPSDFWWADHEAKCGGTFTKVREPEGYSKKKNGHTSVKGGATSCNGKGDIRNFFPFVGEGKVLSTSTLNSNENIILSGKYSGSSRVSSKEAVPANTNIIVSKKLKSNASVQQNSVTAGIPVKISSATNNGRRNIRTFFDKNISTSHSKNGTGNRTPHLNNHERVPPKCHSSSSNSGKSRESGMLANKGSGTLVLTQKGNKHTQKRNNSTNEPESCHSVAAEIAVFSGKGYTVGSTSSQHVPATADKPWLSLLDRIEATIRTKKQSPIVTAASDSSLPQKAGISKVNQNERKIKNPCESEMTPVKKFKNSIVTNSSSMKLDSIADCHNQTSSHRNHASSSANESMSFMISCPTCGIVVEESVINLHLDTCVQEDLEESFTLQDLANCPICSKDFPINEIDHHVDVCLSSKERSTSVEYEEAECDMIKCPMCDEQLLKCSLDVHLESCIQCVSKTDACFIEEGCDNESGDGSGSNCGDNLQPCPVCMSLVKEELMNTHLDECLSADILKEMTQK